MVHAWRGAPGGTRVPVWHAFVLQKGWYWFRYRHTDRHAYLARRRFVERQLYDGYTQKYGSLKKKVPVWDYDLLERLSYKILC